jgi:riboflavin biosynthesis pyrimidine reductase
VADLLEPLVTLFDASSGADVPLPAEIERHYGRLRFPEPADRRRVIANFVQSLDGVVELDDPSLAGGGPISGYNPHDKFVMAVLRAVSDAVVVGAGTLRSVPKHLWTPDHVAADFAGHWASLRSALGKPRYPLNVILTASGSLEGSFRVLEQREVPVLIVTTARGATRLARAGLGPNIQVSPSSEFDEVSAAEVLNAVTDAIPARLVLLEGGPTVMGEFFAAKLVDELFLTRAPQVAGRAAGSHRPGLVDGRLFAPSDPRWASLLSLKSSADTLFLRYTFTAASSASR